MKIYVTSDLHFYHKNIIKICPDTRAKYGDVETMNKEMINEWNSIVNQEDIVYILGDVVFANEEKSSKLIKTLNGKKVLIKGNHDYKNCRKEVFLSCFESVHDYLEIKHEGHKIVMFHYPIHNEWNGAHHGSIHFHGHLHQGKSGLEEFRCRNVGFDYTGKIVWELDDAVKDALRGRICDTHHN